MITAEETPPRGSFSIKYRFVFDFFSFRLSKIYSDVNCD